jgi:hypothetical protein
MPIQYPEGWNEPVIPLLEKALEYLGSYQDALRTAYDGLPDHSKQILARIPNPQLATGPLDVVVCKNGVVVGVLNGVDGEIKANATIRLELTLTQWFSGSGVWDAVRPDSPIWCPSLRLVGIVDCYDPAERTLEAYGTNAVLALLMQKRTEGWL